MATTTPADAKAVVAEAKRDFAQQRAFDGAILKRKVSLGSPMILQIHKRSYDQLGRNAHFIMVLGRVQLGEEQVGTVEADVLDTLRQVHTAFERKVEQLRMLLSQAEIEPATEAIWGKNEPIEVEIVNPVQTQFLKVLALANEAHRLLHTMWLAGEIETKEKSRSELEYKGLLRQIPSKTRRLRLLIQTRVAEARAAGTAKPGSGAALAAAAAVPAGSDHDEADERAGILEAAAAVLDEASPAPVAAAA